MMDYYFITKTNYCLSENSKKTKQQQKKTSEISGLDPEIDIESIRTMFMGYWLPHCQQNNILLIWMGLNILTKFGYSNTSLKNALKFKIQNTLYYKRKGDNNINECVDSYQLKSWKDKALVFIKNGIFQCLLAYYGYLQMLN